MHIIWNNKLDKLNFPTVEYKNEDEAINEAKRLSNKHKGVEFGIYEKVSSYMVPKYQKPLSRNGIIKKLKKMQVIAALGKMSELSELINDTLDRSKKNHTSDNVDDDFEYFLKEYGVSMDSIINSCVFDPFPPCPNCGCNESSSLTYHPGMVSMTCGRCMCTVSGDNKVDVYQKWIDQDGMTR